MVGWESLGGSAVLAQHDCACRHIFGTIRGTKNVLEGRQKRLAAEQSKTAEPAIQEREWSQMGDRMLLLGRSPGSYLGKTRGPMLQLVPRQDLAVTSLSR